MNRINSNDGTPRRSRRRAAPNGKPYRVHRTSRVSPRDPARSRLTVLSSDEAAQTRSDRRRRRGGKRAVVIAACGLFGVCVLVLFWGLLGYRAVAGGVAAANKRLPASARAALAKSAGSMLSTPSDILLLGSENRAGERHSDSAMLLRADPAHHLLAYVSVPRDLLAPIPGYGENKINAAMQMGGPALAVKTISAFTGLPINHLVMTDFARFVQLIDAVGGITVNVDEPILSDKFDCPYGPSRCASWSGWRFAKGPQRMDAHRALIYSRIRVNQLNPADSDVTRGLRQQEVMQALLAKLASVGTFLRLPFDGGTLLKPLSTDLSTWEFMQLAWIKTRATTTLHCRLGGNPDGNGYLIPDSSGNARTLREALGRSRPLPPSSAQGLYAPGCVNGNRPFHG